jgi:hypothetical protein
MVKSQPFLYPSGTWGSPICAVVAGGPDIFIIFAV